MEFSHWPAPGITSQSKSVFCSPCYLEVRCACFTVGRITGTSMSAWTLYILFSHSHSSNIPSHSAAGCSEQVPAPRLHSTHHGGALPLTKGYILLTKTHGDTHSCTAVTSAHHCMKGNLLENHIVNSRMQE